MNLTLENNETPAVSRRGSLSVSIHRTFSLSCLRHHPLETEKVYHGALGFSSVRTAEPSSEGLLLSAKRYSLPHPQVHQRRK